MDRIFEETNTEAYFKRVEAWATGVLERNKLPTDDRHLILFKDGTWQEKRRTKGKVGQRKEKQGN